MHAAAGSGSDSLRAPHPGWGASCAIAMACVRGYGSPAATVAGTTIRPVSLGSARASWPSAASLGWGLGWLGRGFAQASAVGQHDALDCLTQVGPQMPAVSHLNRLWGSGARALGVGTGAVPANDFEE
jgi:hypothetical protein